MSLDGGKTFNNQKSLVLYGTYFFLSNELVNHTRKAENILEIISNLGGMFEILWVLFMYIGNSVNNKYITAKFIREIYSKKKDDVNTLLDLEKNRKQKLNSKFKKR